MTGLTSDEREAKVKRIEAIRKQVAKLEDEKSRLTAELLADSKLGETEHAGTLTYEFVPVLNWRSFDDEAAAVMFPVEDFPQIYQPSYKGTKKLLEQLDSGVSIEQFCDTTPRLYIHHRKSGATRTFRVRKKTT